MSLDLPSESGADEVRFTVSPLVELGWAWHVLVSADHHPERRAWIAATIEHAGDLVEELEAWSFAVRAVRATPMVDPALIPARRWPEHLSRLAELPAEELTAMLLRPLLRVRGRPGATTVAGATGRRNVLSLARARGPATLDNVRLILDRPDAAREAFTDLLRRCWTSFFGAEWEQIAVRLRREAERRTRLGRRDGWARALSDLSPTIRIEDGDRLVIDKVQSKRLTVEGRGLTLVPSVFCAPHVYVGDEPGRPIVLHYSVPAPGRAANGRVTLRRLEVLSSPARLEICRAIAVEPRSATEIARLWGLAESAVTKHLAALRTAGLVRVERAGHFVRYSLDGDALGSVGTDLLDVLRR